MTLKKVHIGIVAPSSKVPQVELTIGVEKLIQEGFYVHVHPQCKKSHLFFAGTDQERAEAFYEYAQSPKIDVVWCGRGGHGALRVLPLLEEMTQRQGIPKKKLLIGYSDSTGLMEYVRTRWGWSILHGPMPSLRKFSILPEADWNALTAWIHQESYSASWLETKLKFVGNSPHRSIKGPLIGGNLTVLNSLLATPFQPQLKNALLFLEDVDESFYRIDRMIYHLRLAGYFQGVKAVILGNFLNCKDTVGRVLKSKPNPRALSRVLNSPSDDELHPLRRQLKEKVAFNSIFGELGDRLGIPIAYGLPVGHGPEVCSLPLGGEYDLSPQGRLKLKKWDWLKSQK